MEIIKKESSIAQNEILLKYKIDETSDNQVKIRGFRVELHEIENVIQSLYEIKHAIVALKGKEGQARKLVGYIVLREGADEKQSNHKIR